ncbi:hypothetical protein U1Q18_040607, partial [Sarracenia purpurea var. burkii]
MPKVSLNPFVALMASASDLGTSSWEDSLPPFNKFFANVGKGALVRSSDGSSPLTMPLLRGFRYPRMIITLALKDPFRRLATKEQLMRRGIWIPVDLEGETEISDIMVRSVELDIALAQQKLKNMLDTKAHQYRIKKGKQAFTESERSLGFAPRQAFGHDSTKCKQKPEDTDQTWTTVGKGKRVPSIGDVPSASSEPCEASRAIREVTQGLDNVINRFAALQEVPNAEASNSLDNPENTSEGPLVQADTSGFPEAECLGTISPTDPGDPPGDIITDIAQQCQSSHQPYSLVRDKKGLLDTALGSDKGHYGRLTVEKKSEPTPVPKGLDAEPTLPDDGEEASAIGQ